MRVTGNRITFYAGETVRVAIDQVLMADGVTPHTTIAVARLAARKDNEVAIVSDMVIDGSSLSGELTPAQTILMLGEYQWEVRIRGWDEAVDVIAFGSMSVADGPIGNSLLSPIDEASTASGSLVLLTGLGPTDGWMQNNGAAVPVVVRYNGDLSSASFHFGPYSLATDEYTDTIPPTLTTVAGEVATTSLDSAAKAAILAAYPIDSTTGIQWHLRAGTPSRPLAMGWLRWDLTGQRTSGVQVLATVVVGPTGESFLLAEDGTGGLSITSQLLDTLTEDGSGGLIVTI